ncbi:YfjI family protein [Saccharopolyspora sp. TS4A08]|uniref:YfjI family protein n=1 Tax=Saccharopolyspora ipomoeae TaxID=3042027 RepID=A0ABT6PP99_9PSEU|nr:YfjI family protein [Saccharopolyspora sp. TS4A08]MDI2029832.1 YfjI family protein [Saccharopolyspora sp. TS4A08]
MPAHLTAVPDTPDDEPGLVWDQPVPLGSQRVLPPFPVDVLPDWLAAQVDAVAVATQTPPDLAGCVALSVVSTAVGGRAIARIRTGWDEPVNIYTVVALPPASRKTPVFRAMTTPLTLAERDLAEKMRPVIEQARLERKAAEALQERAERTATSAEADERESALADALDAALTVHGKEIPPEPRLIADDITPEETASMLAQHGGRLAVLSAEGNIFDILAGRYSGSPNLNVFLKGHGGDMLLVDRKGRPAERVDNPALTLGVTVQPAIIDELAETRKFRGTGLLARFLYSMPENTVGDRIADPPPVPEEVAGAYHERVRGLVMGMHEWTDPAVFAFSPEANDELIDLHNAIEPKLHPRRGEWAHIGDWAGKQVGQTARLAALLHAVRHHDEPWAQPVDGTTAKAARVLSEYFTEHALMVFERLGADPAIGGANTILNWIRDHQITSFTKRDVHRALARRFNSAADLNPCLAVLEEHGHIACIEPPHSGRGRPRSPIYWTHPRYRA